jgi:hypothetical protein
VALEVLLKVPAAQLTGVEMVVAQYWPGEDEQGFCAGRLQELLPAALVLPAGQGVQAALPVVSA